MKTPDNLSVHPNEYEKASNAYLMAIVAVVAGLPIPIVNLIASVGFYLGHRKSSYFIRWHAIQAILAQLVLVPFNCIAWAWTLAVVFNKGFIFTWGLDDDEYASLILNQFSEATAFYWLYIIFVAFLNVFDFFAVLYTATRVRNGHNVRWSILAGITDSLCSKQERDIYKI